MSISCDYPIVGIVPSYQPDEKLEQTIRKTLAELSFLCLIVVDDGGGEQYANFFERISGFPNVTVLHHGVNAGKGAGVKTALQFALWKYPEAIGFVVYDGDGQHAAVDVHKVVKASVENPNKLVLGVRNFHDSALKIPWRSRFGNRLTELVFYAFTGIKLVDTQTGLRVYPRKLAVDLIQIQSNRYEFELEALLLAAKKYDYLQCPIQTIYEDENRRSHFNPVKDSLRIYAVFLKFIGATAVCSVLDYAVFAVGYLVSSAILPSMIVARVISVTLNFVLNRNKVFCSKGRVGYEVVCFLLLAIFLFAASYFGVDFCKQTLGINPLVSKVVVEMGLFFLSFIVQRCVIFSYRIRQ